MRNLGLGLGGVAAFVLFSFSFAHANWSSSGGEIFKEEHNPWFVKNTKIVNYCVSVDTGSVSASQLEVESRVEEAIRYWQAELAKPLLSPPAGNLIFHTIEVGTQSWQKVACDDPTVDVSFLVGFGALTTDDQRNYLKDLGRYIGVAVRTDYDTALRAKGFIYIASDFGPHRYSPDNAQVIDRAWESRRLHVLAIAHELGHLFGFAHKGTGLMSEIFLEQLVSPAWGKIVESSPMPAVLMPNLDLMDCEISPIELQYLGQAGGPNATLCVYLKFNTSLPGLLTTGAEIEVFGSKEAPVAGQPEPAKFKIGTLKRVLLNLLDMQMDPAVFLHLPPNQTVFGASEVGAMPFFVGPMFQEFGGEAIFAPADPNASVKPAYFKVGPTYFRLYGQQSNRLRPVFESETALGFQLNIGHH